MNLPGNLGISEKVNYQLMASGLEWKETGMWLGNYKSPLKKTRFSFHMFSPTNPAYLLGRGKSLEEAALDESTAGPARGRPRGIPPLL